VLFDVRDKFADWRMATCGLNIRGFFDRIGSVGVHTGSCVIQEGAEVISVPTCVPVNQEEQLEHSD
jgi:hypothetical protein